MCPPWIAFFQPMENNPLQNGLAYLVYKSKPILNIHLWGVVKQAKKLTNCKDIWDFSFHEANLVKFKYTST